MTPTILTHSGVYVDLVNPTEDQILIEDIAWGLSKICRFAGHTSEFYSVAQHSFLASFIVSTNKLALEAILHDAQEAYLGDVSSPLKMLLPEYKKIEKNFERVIRAKFKLPEEMSWEVKRADRIMLATEKRDFMHSNSENIPWECLDGVEPMLRKIEPMSSESAYEEFLATFNLWTKLAS